MSQLLHIRKTLTALLLAASAMSYAAQRDTTFVRLTDGNIHAFPAMLLKQRQQTASQVIFTDIDGGQHTYNRSDIASESTTTIRIREAAPGPSATLRLLTGSPPSGYTVRRAV